MSTENLNAVAQRFRLLGEPLRLRLLEELGGGERTVNDLVEAMGGTQPNISRHLNALFQGGLLLRRRDGVRIYYAIADRAVFRLFDLAGKGIGKKRRRAG